MRCHKSNPRGRGALAVVVATAGLTLSAVHADEPLWSGGDGKLEVASTTFTDGGAFPPSMIYNAVTNGVNVCTADGAMGGDQSPQLAWTHVPDHTRSFVVVLYDTTASFTHWGMYNIARDVRALPKNAGTTDSRFGTQISNDFGDLSYDGPCPPAGVAPDAHHYVFTVYALDTELTVEGAPPNFPAGAEALYHSLIRAGREGHILASGSIASFYSSTPPAN
ncbi:MAG TPA: YbhB/YbcL family Raf kinase inhibitor-like protein [Steroidobacteraceae bacterium]|jgi:Raf kinase inhibitor-like YbhB/YbcL family protein|nr:YbhB/YbcL family Raf kinase inhibitor-like protein [Steroidobacteraceae bacterium]